MKIMTIRRYKLYLQLIVISAMAAIVSLSWAVDVTEVDVESTVHNLSATGPGTVSATSEQRICAFCHAPHNAQPAEPLWNHKLSTASYTMYDSEYLQRVDSVYDVSADLGIFPAVGYRSRLCLSCHDGTVAIGSVYNLSGSTYDAATGTFTTIGMTGVEDPGGELLTSSAANLGINLTDDHPVAIKYDENAEISFDTGGPRSIELKSGLNKPPVQGVGGTYYEVRLENYSGDSYVECPSCHDPHTTNEKFLVLNSGSLAQSINDICDRCHEKTNWVGSIHQTDATAIDDPVAETQPIPDGIPDTVAEAGCASCHKVHSGVGTPYLLRKAEENTCFYISGIASTSCHGSGVGVPKELKIYDMFQTFYKHPVDALPPVRHTNLDVLQIGVSYDADDLRWDLGNEHAECVDCHNPHQTLKGTHVSVVNQWYPQLPDASTNDVSNALLGVTGVDHPNEDPLWSDIDLLSYRTMNSAVKEYQICFKCHSSYAIRNLGSPDTIYTTGSGAVITDQAWEFSRGNKSAHPVRVTLNNMITGIAGASFPGSYPPKALTDAQMSTPWKSEGDQTMYCSDCHGAESEDTTDPRGPHGSNSKYMLKGPGKYWPTKSDGITLWQLDDSSTFSSGGLFCMNCHVIYDGSWKNNVHSQWSGMGGGHRNITCIECHVAVPHGSERSRLIGYNSDPSPYDYNNNSLKVTGFKKAAGPNSYNTGNCSTLSGFGCTGGPRHSTSISGAD